MLAYDRVPSKLSSHFDLDMGRICKVRSGSRVTQFFMLKETLVPCHALYMRLSQKKACQPTPSHGSIQLQRVQRHMAQGQMIWLESWAQWHCCFRFMPSLGWALTAPGLKAETANPGKGSLSWAAGLSGGYEQLTEQLLTISISYCHCLCKDNLRRKVARRTLLIKNLTFISKGDDGKSSKVTVMLSLSYGFQSAQRWGATVLQLHSPSPHQQGELL